MNEFSYTDINCIIGKTIEWLHFDEGKLLLYFSSGDWALLKAEEEYGPWDSVETTLKLVGKRISDDEVLDLLAGNVIDRDKVIKMKIESRENKIQKLKIEEDKTMNDRKKLENEIDVLKKIISS